MGMERLSVNGRSMTVHPSDRGDAPLVVINTVADEGEEIISAVRALSDEDPSFLIMEVTSWNDDLTPWPSPPVFGKEGYGGRADGYIRDLTEDIIPYAEKAFSLSPAYRIIAGYSLAGLFALYSLYRTDMFSRAVSASGSMWYPGFADFAGSNDLAVRPDRIYVSLGDRESRTRNKVMSRVADDTDTVCGILGSRSREFRYESNPGNHFTDPVGRLAKGIVWVLG